ncbi:MAG: 2-oxo acid dehydrogenase subunit E2 [Treponema sp.]|jgi:pyruvate dehydrogenase E2 component (dihydrolipoamide acetyltransferase)|nr:2-oxo acid dehydrogenase subunit E2 [Treponema sp.]
MAERIILPKQGLQMTEGTILEWLVKEGEKVTQDQPLFEMETDKLTIVIDAPVSGTLLKIIAGKGDTRPITSVIAIVGNPGEDISGILAELDSGEQAAPPAGRLSAGVGMTPGAASADGGVPAASGPVPRTGGEIFISPRAKMRAREFGIDYKNIRGSASAGMIVERDIIAAKNAGVSLLSQTAAASPLAKKTAELEGVDISLVQGTGARGKIMRGDVIKARRLSASGAKNIIPLKGMRKIIAERMKQSQNENAQTFHRISVRMDEAVRVRTALEKAISYNDLIAFAGVRSLVDFPAMNAELTPEGIWRKDFVNLGIAVALGEGLIVPVVKDADLLTLRELSSAIKERAEKARNGTLAPGDYSGGSFTISNLGMYGLEEFAAIINPPEAGILAVGRIEDTPVAVQGAVEIHPVMKLTLSYDHRVVDGAPAAEFLARIKDYLENPYKLL